MNSSRFSLTVATLGLALISGCSGGPADRPETIPVKGQVVMNGKPVEGATVSFWAGKAPRAAMGTTDAEGRFELSMFSLNDGAIEGVNVITVTKVDTTAQAGSATMNTTPTDPSAMTQSYVETMKAMEKNNGKKGAIPAVYASREQTPLKETVTKGADNSFVIQLVE